MPSLKHFSSEDGLTAIAAAIEQDGACIVDELIPESLCDALMSDFMPVIDDTEWCNMTVDDTAFAGLEDQTFFGAKTKRFHGLPGLSAHVEKIISHPLLLEIAYGLLGAGTRCRDVRVSNMELMVLGQGEQQQSFHRDFDSWPYVQVETLSLISANIAMCDFTETNGATVVVPGSHQWPADREPSPEESCQALMKKGSALIYSGHVVHGGGSNKESDMRTGLYIGYIPSWLSNLENHAVSNSPEAIARMHNKTQTLLDIVPGGWIVIP